MFTRVPSGISPFLNRFNFLLDDKGTKGVLNRFIESVQSMVMEDFPMTTLAMSLSIRPLAGQSLRSDLVQLWRNQLARHRHRQMLRRLARYSPRLIADMGLETHDVLMAVENSWDEYRPDLMLRPAPWI